MKSFYSALRTFNLNFPKRSQDECVADVVNGKEYSFYTKKITGPLDVNDGDVLVGFFYDDIEKTFQIKIGDETQECKVSWDNMIFPFGDSIVPLVKLVYHKVEISDPDIYGVFACLSQDMRKFLVTNTFYIDDYKYQSGMFGKREDVHTLPKFEPVRILPKFEPVRIPIVNS